jgi:hypothetical protein
VLRTSRFFPQADDDPVIRGNFSIANARSELRRNAPAVVYRLFPDCEALFGARRWTSFLQIDRVYVNDRARTQLGWQPKYDFRYVLDCLRGGTDFRSRLACEVGSKGYHDNVFDEGSP